MAYVYIKIKKPRVEIYMSILNVLYYGKVRRQTKCDRDKHEGANG